ncbi:MAG: BrnT family toxin [Xanthobacteraceae bacterium]
MEIAFHPAKDAVNRAKHGVSLGEAARLDWNWLLVKFDTRADYGEPRQIGYGPIGRRLHCVVFVDRGNTRRIISLRKANTREIDRYEAQIDSTDES